MNEDPPKGQRARLDEAAESADPELPAFIARPPGAPVYHGFPLLENSECEGFVFGTITQPQDAEWGDAYVVAPNGSRAGIVWAIGRGAPTIVSAPDEGRWGVYGFYFEGPIRSDADLVARLHSVIPALRAHYKAAEIACPESTRPVSRPRSD